MDQKFPIKPSSVSCSGGEVLRQGSSHIWCTFLIYINDLPSGLVSTVKLFADDCILYRSVAHIRDCQILQDDLFLLTRWEKLWQLKLNVRKCYAMSISHKKVSLTFSYSINGCVLKRVKNYPYLGVTISDNLFWSRHIHKVICKLNRTLGLLRRNLWNCKSEVKETAYKCLVRPQLEYACAAWDPHLKNDIYNSEMFQRRTARFVCRDYRREAAVVSSLLEKLRWQTLQERRKYARLTLFYKIVNKHVAVDTGNLLRASTRNTRRNSALSPASINIQTTKDCSKIILFPSNRCRLESTLPSNS